MSKFKIGDLVFVNAGAYCSYFGEITASEINNDFWLYKLSILDEDGYLLSPEEIPKDCLELADEPSKNNLPNRVNYLKN